MADSVREVQNVGFVGKIIESIKGVVVGIVMALAAFPLIFWNEGRAVTTARSLDEGQAAVVPVDASAVDAAHEGKLVHFQGEAVTSDTLSDSSFGVSLQAIKLRREAEMYQWEEESRTETRSKVGGGEERVTTYTYHQTWSSDLIDSSEFRERDGHQNPVDMPWQGAEYVAQNVTVGAFGLSPDLVEQMSDWQALTVDASLAATLPEALRATAKPAGGKYYFGADPASPRIGDVRVGFSVVHPAQVSIVAQQKGAGTQAYQTDAGDALAMLEYGPHSAEEMFQMAKTRNAVLTWVLRGVAFLMLWIGLSMVLRPISVVAGVVPFFGSMVGAFTGTLAGLVAFFLWFVTVAISWIVVRPMLAIALLVVAALAGVAAIGLTVMFVRQYRANNAAAPA
jgi:hypothetical protein